MLSSIEQTSDKMWTLQSYGDIDKVDHTSRNTALEQSNGAKKLICVLQAF